MFLIFGATTGSVYAYEPPVGIPIPTFGIDESSPAQPSNWPSLEAAGYYYIDNNHPSATDSGNTYGYPGKPRMSIPTGAFPAGTYIEINGGPYPGSGPLVITANGTPTQPVWIRGGNATNKTLLNRGIKMFGSYYIVENLRWNNNLKGFGFGVPSHHAAFRSNELEGSRTSLRGSVIGVSGDATFRNNNLVMYKNKIHGFGDNTGAAGENDVHGIKPRNDADDIWILENEIYQINKDY